MCSFHWASHFSTQGICLKNGCGDLLEVHPLMGKPRGPFLAPLLKKTTFPASSCHWTLELALPSLWLHTTCSPLSLGETHLKRLRCLQCISTAHSAAFGLQPCCPGTSLHIYRLLASCLLAFLRLWLIEDHTGPSNPLNPPAMPAP